jgi:hypothetical protein
MVCSRLVVQHGCVYHQSCASSDLIFPYDCTPPTFPWLCRVRDILVGVLGILCRGLRLDSFRPNLREEPSCVAHSPSRGRTLHDAAILLSQHCAEDVVCDDRRGTGALIIVLQSIALRVHIFSPVG